MRAVPPYVPGEQPAAGRRVVKLNTNENPYPPSPRVAEALGALLRDPARLRLYPDPVARGLRERAAATYGRPVDGVLVGNGSDELIGLLVRALVDPGAAVAFPSPTYSLYETVVALHGAHSVEVSFPDDWRLPVEALAAVQAPLTFVCNPNSPSGTTVPLADLDALAERLDGVLVVDEAYVDFADADAVPLLDRRSNVIVLRTCSKSFALAGLRVGFALGHPELLAGLATLKDSYNVNVLTQVAAAAALADAAHMRAAVARIRATRARLVEALETLGYRVPASAANFVLAVRPGVDQAPVAAALADRGVLVRHFATPRLSDALRVTVGTDEEIDALLAALRAVLT